jgi:hypothetical protein
MITLRIRQLPSVPLEAESISPDRMASQSNDAIRALPVFLGKRQCRLDEFFEFEGDGSDQIEIHGDLSKVKWIGREMTRGQIKIVGSAGMSRCSRGAICCWRSSKIGRSESTYNHRLAPTADPRRSGSSTGRTKNFAKTLRRSSIRFVDSRKANCIASCRTEVVRQARKSDMSESRSVSVKGRMPGRH